MLVAFLVGFGAGLLVGGLVVCWCWATDDDETVHGLPPPQVRYAGQWPIVTGADGCRP
jgi:hypothetical protein